MRGMLSFMVLWLLSKKTMYGQELAEEIGKRKGEKPNPGTIYPCLKDLSKKGLVVVRQDGRSTVYELTKLGKSSLAEAQEYFARAYGEIFYSTPSRRV